MSETFMKEPWYLALKEKYHPYRRGKNRCRRCGRRIDWHTEYFEHSGERESAILHVRCLKEMYHKEYLKTFVARWASELWNQNQKNTFFEHFL